MTILLSHTRTVLACVLLLFLCCGATPMAVAEFVLVPGGTNRGVDPDHGEYMLRVAAFRIGRGEVTKARWDLVRNWAGPKGYTDLGAGGGRAPDHPVQSVTWFDVVKWCNARSEKEGLTPCYRTAEGVFRTGKRQDVVFDGSADGYRLPFEVEWEFAARGGLVGRRFPWGDRIDHSCANYHAKPGELAYDVALVADAHPGYRDGGGGHTNPAGSFPANGYGLFDVAGNVQEWCWDAFGQGVDRTNRGGSWNNDARWARVATRNNYAPDQGYYGLGFRLAQSVLPASDRTSEPPLPGREAAAEAPVEFVEIAAGRNSGTNPLARGEVHGQRYPETYSLVVAPLLMGTREVTKARWDTVRAWGLEHGYSDLAEGKARAPSHPVHSVSWHHVVKWLNARSEMEGRTACYTVVGEVYRTGKSDTVVCDFQAAGYRLPTSDEWEYAARAGLRSARFPHGETLSHAEANYAGHDGVPYDASFTRGLHPDSDAEALPFTSPVGSFVANGYGLHDMSGNVWEWCWDWFPGQDGVCRVRRGGSWYDNAASCRVGFRDPCLPGADGSRIGFRACFTAPTEDVRPVP